MKKVLIALLLIFSISVSAQTVIHTSSSRMGKWDALSEHYNYTDWSNSDITFTANSTGVTATDYTGSVYVFTTKKTTKTGVLADKKTKFTTYSWECYDEKYKDCSFNIIYYSDGGGKISVFYDHSNIVYNYTIDNSANNNYN